MTKRIVLSALILSCFFSIPAQADDKENQIAQLRAMVQQLEHFKNICSHIAPSRRRQGQP